MAVLEGTRMAAPTANAESVAVRPDTVDWRRIAVLGLVIAGTAPLWVLAPEGLAALSFVAPLVAVPLLTAAALWRFGAWTRVLSVLVGLGLLAFAAPLAAEVVGHPDSFFDFFPAVSMLLGGVLAVGGGTAASAQHRRGPDRVGPGTARVQRAVAVFSVAGLLALGGVSAVLTVTGQHTVSALDRYGAEPVTMVGFRYEPEELVVRAGRDARFVVANDDLALHTFTVDEFGVDLIVKPRSEGLVEFTPDQPGVYLLYCRPHTQDGQGMVGTLVVE